MTERLNNNHLSYMYPFPVFVSKCPIKEIENTLGILNRKNFIKELIIKVFEELEKPKKKKGGGRIQGCSMIDECLEDTTRPRTGREKEKWCCQIS